MPKEGGDVQERTGKPGGFALRSYEGNRGISAIRPTGGDGANLDDFEEARREPGDVRGLEHFTGFFDDEAGASANNITNTVQVFAPLGQVEP